MHGASIGTSALPKRQKRTGETACGALIEAGAALAAGRQVFVVSSYEWTFANHPRCRVFVSLDAAIAAIVAMQQGELAREAMRGGA
jgi:hypothetical protein